MDESAYKGPEVKEPARARRSRRARIEAMNAAYAWREAFRIVRDELATFPDAPPDAPRLSPSAGLRGHASLSDSAASIALELLRLRR